MRRIIVLALPALAVAVVATLSACGGTDRPPLSAEAASFDVAVGSNDRLMVGVSDNDGNVLAGGKVRMSFAPLDGSGEKFEVDAPFIPVPGRPDVSVPTRPTLIEPSEGVGLYAAPDVSFATAGPWEIRVDAGSAGTAITAVMVNDRHYVPVVGQPAPRTDNPTVDSPGISPGELDSEVKDAGLNDLRDRVLHTTSITSALDAHRPLVVVVSTPVYCLSRFCGPTTDRIAALAPAHPGITFVHLEVWKDFDKGVLNPSARQWIKPSDDPDIDGNEPWVFTVDAAGKVTGRWDNVLDEPALLEEIARLERP